VSAVQVGLVGAGPWAELFTAPLLATGGACTLTAVWARRHEQAERIARRHGAVVADSFDDLLGTCEAIAFAVPPDVQAGLACRAAEARLPVLLDKPIGLGLDEAERLADVIGSSGVASQLVLTNRYRPSMRSFLAAAGPLAATAGRAMFLGAGAVPGGHFATPWRMERGAPLDLGPHVLDALDAALGTIVETRATGDPLGVVTVTCTHADGAVSQAVLSVTTPGEPSGLVVELFGRQGRLVLDTTDDDGHDVRTAMATIASEFATTVRSGVPHQLDVRRGLYLQHLIHDIDADLVT
jgi:predicted dehydrogenase